MKVILFTEKNSPYGIEFLKRIHEHEKVSSVMLVTRESLMPFNYYQYDNQLYDIKEIVKELNVKHIEQDDLKNQDFLKVIKQFDPDLIVIGNFQKKLNSELCNLAKERCVKFSSKPSTSLCRIGSLFLDGYE